MSSKFLQSMSIMTLIFWLCLDAIDIYRIKQEQQVQRQVNESQFQINEVTRSNLYALNQLFLMNHSDTLTISNASGATVEVLFPSWVTWKNPSPRITVEGK